MPDGFALTGRRTGDSAGSRARAGDVTCDGQADLLVSASHFDADGSDNGVVHVAAGPIVSDASLDPGQARLLGNASSYSMGTQIELLPDVDGDGCAEVVVGMLGTQTGSGGAQASAVYILHGPLSGDMVLPELGVSWTAADVDDNTGVTLAAMPDATGDGLADLLLGRGWHELGRRQRDGRRVRPH